MTLHFEIQSNPNSPRIPSKWSKSNNWGEENEDNNTTDADADELKIGQNTKEQLSELRESGFFHNITYRMESWVVWIFDKPEGSRAHHFAINCKK
jgi:hypothetical protein